MQRVNSIFQIPDLVLEAWKKQWSPNTSQGFSMFCGDSWYSVPPSNRYDMWVWVRSNAQHPRLRGRVNLRQKK